MALSSYIYKVTVIKQNPAAFTQKKIHLDTENINHCENILQRI